jgi:hypothetical protein
MKMQIIIVQSEIETAIRNHINSLLNVKDGNRIEIQLSATRGEDGFKATIDIVSDDAPGAPAAAANQAPVAVTRHETALTASHASVKVASPQPASTPVPESTGGAAAEAGPATSASAEPSSTEPAAAVATAEQPAEAAAAPSRSLFAGLKKPVNQAAA